MGKPEGGSRLPEEDKKEQKTREVVESLKLAHAEWKATPEEERGVFNGAWLVKNKYGSLYNWMYRHGGVSHFAPLAGADIEKDFEISVIRERTAEAIIEEFRIAHGTWKALPEEKRGRFNITWLVKNKYVSLYNWMLKRGGASRFASLAGGEVAEDFEVSIIKKITPAQVEKNKIRNEQIIEILKLAHGTWKALPEEKRGPFNGAWLRKNGFDTALAWMYRHGGVSHFASLAGADIEKDFEVTVVNDRTPESAIDELRAAHAEWKGLPVLNRVPFTSDWLINNGHNDIKIWMYRHGGLPHFITLAGGEVAEDFEVGGGIKDRTPESAIDELRAAHAEWKGLKDKKEAFSRNWLKKYNYGVVLWTYKRGGLLHFITLAGGEVAEDFEVGGGIKDRTSESVANELRTAHAEWKELPETERGPFNAAWLSENFSSLTQWMRKHSGVLHYVVLAGGEVAENFERYVAVHDRTPESAIDELRTAHAEWKELPETERGPFNASWLKDNKYSGLLAWMQKNNDPLHIAALAGGEVAEDFERSGAEAYTAASVIEKLKFAHTKWKELPEEKRGKFHVGWLQQNGYSYLTTWTRENGGMLYFIALAGGEIEKDFEGHKLLKEKALKQKLVDTLVELRKPEGHGKEFQNLINIFGASRCVDILFKFRPEFKGLSVEYIKSSIADYLGDFLAVKGSFNPRVEFPMEYLSDLSLQEGLYETIKDNCLRYYYEERKKGKADSHAIIYGYLDHIIEQVGNLSSEILDDVIQKVVLYYDSVLRDFHKPEQFVEELSATREFPDINQRINMKELTDKKRLLIGDEMGMGKSASVIMAKEQLGVQCAVVIAPANVIHTKTWQKYLSDNRAEAGYYKDGQAPRVLVVDSTNDLKNITAQDYDYILISQERMDEDHAALLEQVDYGMLIVDEVHKVKAIEGKRSSNVIRLAEKIQGEDKYVALLSGTPIPNKVEDIAVVLKMLYPDKFSKFSNKALVSQIINGDVIDLRALLLPRMQMKNLEESVEMPELAEKVLPIELGQLEREIYEVLLEEDELTAMEKMVLLRRFLLHPEVVEPTPNIESTKLQELSRSLQSVFKEKSKIVVFVNGYVEDILRGDKTILTKLGLPASIDVRVIDGSTSKVNRAVTQKEFNTSSHKMLLLVSGDTADVGIDFSAGEKVIFYNEPWTLYQKKQELGRVFRPGLNHALETETFVTKGTIEQGINEYILRKYQAVEKLLRGIPITELEKELLKQDEANKNGGPDRSVSPELAEYYFSSWDTLLRMFSFNKEIGEEKFREFLQKHGEEYADCYLDLGNRSYQANANRVAATVLQKLMVENNVDTTATRILDLASGPEMLKQHIADDLQDRVFSIDINKEHFKKTEGDKRVVGSILQTPFAASSFEYVNLALALHYTDFAPAKDKYARLESLMETSRILKVGGKAVVSLIYSMELADMEKFAEVADMLGLKVVEQYSGSVESGKAYSSQLVTLEKVRDTDPGVSAEDLSKMMTKEQNSSLKFAKSKKGLKDSRQVITNFNLNGQAIEIKLNTTDQKVWEEEQVIKKLGRELKNQYGSIEDIPKSEVVNNGFVRLKITDEKYILFKKLTQGTGAVVVR